ncbi:MAG TPA: TetR/AcrR family transcriptional regulator [Acidimicrobiales bacterium]|jgi:AcrR family transcriptional regulator|nr:TetR/AcrR family transcriptional regulator [Acidimicrobiales bacterium]
MVQAALAAIRAGGAHVGMDDIAAQAGVSKPILYRYFADKADLYLAVGRWTADELLAEVLAVLDEDRGPRAHVAAIIDTYLRAVERDPDVYRFVVRRTFPERQVGEDPVAECTAMVASRVSRIIRQGLDWAGLDSSGAEAWGHGLVGLVQATGDWWLEHRALPRERLTDQLTTLVWEGLAGRLAAAGLDPEDTAWLTGRGARRWSLSP